MSPALLATLDQNMRRLAALCDRLQEQRLVHARLVTERRTLRRICNLPAWTGQIPSPSVYTFTRSNGVLRMVPRPAIQGGAGLTGRPFEFARFSTNNLPEATVLRVEGEVDLATAQLLANAVAGAYRTNGRVIVDLSRVEYLDASGIHVLEDFARTHGPRFVVVGSRPAVHRLFHILELTDVLPVVATVDAAREYLRRQ